MRPDRYQLIRSLFDEYIEMYASRDERLTARFSENFSGYTGGGNFLVKDRDEWAKITRQDFAQVTGRIRIEMLDCSMQDISDDVIVVTAFFHIHLPIPDQILSRETARLVLIFRLEGEDWKIVHSGISIPYHLVQGGEVYPIKGLQERNSELGILVEERTRALHASEARLQATIDSAPDAVISIDMSGRMIDFNPAAETIFGWKKEEVLGRLMGEILVPEEHRRAHHQGLARFVRTRKTHIINQRVEITALRRDGAVFPVELTITSIRQNNEDIFTAYIRDITERKEMESQVRQLAFYDSLTRLPNRRLLNDRLNQAMAASKRSNCYAALMFLDLDNFKPLNDTYGHAVGDLLLIEAADRLKNCVREMDTVARFGGDEFVVIISELDVDKAESTAQAEVVAEKIRSMLSDPYLLTIKHEGDIEIIVEHHCTVSIGVTLFVNHEASQNDIVVWADGAMYQAKEAGRNLIRFYDPTD